MKQVKRKILLVLLTVVLARTVASTASAMEWHKTENYTFSVGEPAEIYFWAEDGNFVLLEFNWSGGLVKIIAQANEPVLGIQKAKEFQSTLYPASPYRAFPVGNQLDTWWKTASAETLIQFYWVNHEGPSWWQFDATVMDETATNWNYVARYCVVTNLSASTILVEEWRNY